MNVEFNKRIIIPLCVGLLAIGSIWCCIGFGVYTTPFRENGCVTTFISGTPLYTGPGGSQAMFHGVVCRNGAGKPDPIIGFNMDLANRQLLGFYNWR